MTIRAELTRAVWRLDIKRDIDHRYILHYLRVAEKHPQPLWKYGSDFLEKIETVEYLARQSTEELFTLYYTAMLTEDISGDMAIVGVYRGGDAVLIARTKKSERTLHLFDMFEEGMPASRSPYDDWPAGSHKSSLQQLQLLLGDYDNIHFYPGFFPQTAWPITEKVFSWVHIDADLYQTTMDALLFFSQRMTPGGLILCHDYWNICAVKAACDEFVATTGSCVLVPLAGSHCCLVRTCQHQF